MSTTINPGTPVKPGWSKPSTLLFPTEIPTDPKVLQFAIALAREFHATLVLFHVYDTMVVAASETSGIRYFDYTAAARIEMRNIEPIAQQVREAGVPCEVVLRPGLAADQILAYLREREIDRVIMGTHSPGRIGKFFIGSVAESVLRSSPVPTFVIGPDTVDAQFRNYATQNILCAVTLSDPGRFEATFAAQLALQHKAHLVLQHVIRPSERAEVLANRSIADIEADLLKLVPQSLQEAVELQAVVVPGDPAEELLFQARAHHADLIVIGAHGASTLAAVTSQSVVHRVLAHSQCPVLALSSVVQATLSAKSHPEHALEIQLTRA